MDQGYDEGVHKQIVRGKLDLQKPPPCEILCEVKKRIISIMRINCMHLLILHNILVWRIGDVKEVFPLQMDVTEI